VASVLVSEIRNTFGVSWVASSYRTVRFNGCLKKRRGNIAAKLILMIPDPMHKEPSMEE
jgi:hypothetical protein